MQLLFVGDVMLGRLVNDVLREKPPEYPWGDTLKLFTQADMRACNLECVLSDGGIPWSRTPKAFHFRSDAKNVAVLQEACIDFVSLANNHVLDFGEEAMLDTIEILKEAGISFAGAGLNLDQAMQLAVREFGDVRAGMLSFTDNEPIWEAGEDSPGIFYVPIGLENKRAERLFQLVREARKEVDLLIIAAHWGPNWGYRPQQEHIPFAHALVDAGADIIFGHSCHVFQGIEIYKGKPILYSTGDFIDDYAVDDVERNDESFIFIVEWSEGNVQKLKLHPTVITAFQAQHAQEGMAKRIAAKMMSLCEEFGTSASWGEHNQCLEVVL